MENKQHSEEALKEEKEKDYKTYLKANSEESLKEDKEKDSKILSKLDVPKSNTQPVKLAVNRTDMQGGLNGVTNNNNVVMFPSPKGSNNSLKVKKNNKEKKKHSGFIISIKKSPQQTISKSDVFIQENKYDRKRSRSIVSRSRSPPKFSGHDPKLIKDFNRRFQKSREKGINKGADAFVDDEAIFKLLKKPKDQEKEK